MPSTSTSVGLCGLRVRLVVDGQVVVDVLGGLAVHPAQSVLDDVTDLVAERRVVGDDGRVRARQQQRVAVLMLQALAVERGATGGGADDEAARHLVHRRPESVARALEAEHRVEDVDRDHRLAVGGVGRSDGGERGNRARLVDALVEDRAVACLLVRQHQLAVDGDVLLTVRGVDLRGGEQRVHAEGACLVRDDRHESRPDAGLLHQVLQQPHECHRRGDRLLARAARDDGVRVRRRAAAAGLACVRRVGIEPPRRRRVSIMYSTASSLGPGW